MATLKERLNKEREKILEEIKNLKLEDYDRETFLRGKLAGLELAEKLEYVE